eukprot:316350-Ditylum_brightwellii.AAC.1
MSKREDFLKWKNSCPIHATANINFAHLVTMNIKGYCIFKLFMNRKEKNLLYSITKAAIDSKIVDPIIETNEKLYCGADGQRLWEKLEQQFEETKHNYASLLHMFTNIQAMSKHSTETPMTYPHHFTIAVNKLHAAVSPGEDIQAPPTHMLTY